jgi:class 3 adenylate cyclase
VPAILDHGGEVLKFMGDGLLAIFPIAGGDANAVEACRRALAAARAAQTNVEALAEPAGIEHFDGVGFRLALHLGDVLYGNIGGGNRLDFTCIGQAVNLAARMGCASTAASSSRSISLPSAPDNPSSRPRTRSSNPVPSSRESTNFRFLFAPGGE